MVLTTHDSALSRNSGWAIWNKQQLFARSTEWGSRPIVHAARQVLETHKKFLRDNVVVDKESAHPSIVLEWSECRSESDTSWSRSWNRSDWVRRSSERWPEVLY